MSFYEFLGHNLIYWGSKSTKRKRQMKLHLTASSQSSGKGPCFTVWNHSIYCIQVLHYLGLFCMPIFVKLIYTSSLFRNNRQLKMATPTLCARYPRTYIIINASEAVSHYLSRALAPAGTSHSVGGPEKQKIKLNHLCGI